MSWPVNSLQTHCVSRPDVEYFARFFNGDSHLQPHCVSRRLPVNSMQWIRREPRWPLRLHFPHQTTAQSILAVVVRVAASPTPTRPPVTLLLAARLAADMLAIADAGVRREPLPANPTRTLATHPALRVGQRPAETPPEGKRSGQPPRHPGSLILKLRGGSIQASRGGSILASAEGRCQTHTFAAYWYACERRSS